MEKLEKKLSGKTWLAIIIVSLVGQVAWAIENNFFNLFIKDVFEANLSQIALMVSVSAVAATLTTLLIGALSDKIGKRKLFICIGYILWGISIIIFAIMQSWSKHLESLMGASAATIGVALVIIFDCIMTFFGSSANDACFNAWLTDITDDSNRGKVEGVNAAMPLLSMLLVFGGAMFLSKETGDGGVTYNYSVLFTIIGVVVILIGILNFFIIDEPVLEKNNESNYFKNIFHGFRPSIIKCNKILYLVLVTFGIFNISVQVFMPYFVIYLSLLLGGNYVFIMAPAIVLAAIFTIVFGKIIDKIGYIRSLPISYGIYIVGLILLTAFANVVCIFLGSLLMIAGFLSGNACFGAMIREKTPKKETGLFQGIRIVMQVLVPMLIGPWIGSIISSGGVDAGFGVVGDGYTPSSFIYLGGAVVSLLILIPYIFTIKALKKEKED